MKLADLVRFRLAYRGTVDPGTGIIVGTCEDMSHPPPKNPETLWRVLFPKSKIKIFSHIRSGQLEVISEAG